jgi:class 3 adenylate cyclase
MAHAGTVTLLFTDLVNSTELLSRAGDEAAQRIFKTHHKLLSDAVAANGGHEVKWLGDGLMVAFPSAADAVRCAIAIQQSARRPAAGARLGIRVGLHVGEAIREEADYFGTAVVIARRLCERAASGQILCSALVAGLLAGRHAFQFSELGAMQLKGLNEPIPACEVSYQRDDPVALLSHTPFVGRVSQVERLKQELGEVRRGRGALVMLVGEPGIGKTRTLEEFAEIARNEQATVLWGRCYEGEWAPPFGPFAEAIAEYARGAEPETLRRELSYGGPPLARLVPAIRERLPDLGEPAPLAPEEERFRLLDAVSQLLIAVSARTPLVIVLDDLHWADRGTIAMLRHVAHFIAHHRILLLGAYRDVELDRQHPLADALSALRRVTEYERIVLKGLERDEVGELLKTVADQQVPEALVTAISTETDGNPFFIREVLLHLSEEKKIFRRDGRWTSDLTIEQLGIPEGVRQVIGRRLSRLSEDANRLLAAASAFNGAFHFGIAADVAGLEQEPALKALDAALHAQLIRPAELDSYDFTHALIRHTLYAELSPSRQVRMHRAIAEAMERAWATRVKEHAAQVAYHYSRSSTLPGAESGAKHAIAAADKAETAYAHDDVVTFLRIALELLPKDDARRPRLLGRLALALGYALKSNEAVNLASEAGEMIAAAEGDDAAADYLGESVRAMMAAGAGGASQLAAQGLRHIGRRRDLTWALLTAADIQREEAEDPEYSGIALDTPRRRELAAVLENIAEEAEAKWPPFAILRYFSSREAAKKSGIGAWLAGDLRGVLRFYTERAAQDEQRGEVGMAATMLANASRVHTALGDFASARAAFDKASRLAARLVGTSVALLYVSWASYEMCLVLDEGWVSQATAWGTARASVFRVAAAQAYAHLDRADKAMPLLASVVVPMERGAFIWDVILLACDGASTLWRLGQTDHADVVERTLRERIIPPDFRYSMRDARLSLARLCALQGRYDEAIEWFAKSRAALDEQGARPLRAIADLDEGWMYLRRRAAGDRERAKPLLDAAMSQFRTIGMTGWLRRAESLRW